ncbi:MAG: hypothetical protein LBC20_13310, partial [Planctomycetaceae bacterium]|jgi:hypothetical protein|nr:hypothetical protein [Planctomycetaceae bacterium]
MFLFSTYGKYSRLAVFLHDGYQWYAYVFAYRKSFWHTLAQTTFTGKNPRQIPPQLLEFAETNKVRRVRIVLPQNVQKLDLDSNIELPYDAAPEELQTIVAQLFSQTTGQEFGTFRVASAFADTFRMGGTNETLYVAAFELSQLELYEKLCQPVGLRFDGCGALEMAALAVGTRLHDESRFLILKRDTSFYAVGATEQLPMMTSGIAFGTPPDERVQETERSSERLQSVARRINTQKSIPLQIWYASGIDEKRLEEVHSIIDSETPVSLTNLSEIAEEIAREIAATTEPNVPAGGGAVAGLPEKERSPYYVGTWLFVFAVVFALLFILISYCKLNSDLNSINAKTAAWEKLRSERKKLNDKLAAIDAQRNKNEKIIKLLTRKNPLPTVLVPLLIELNENMPVYTRLTEFEQISDDELLLTGYTLYQDGFLKLRPKLNQKMNEYNTLVEQKTLEKIPDSNEQRFVLRVYPSGSKP